MNKDLLSKLMLKKSLEAETQCLLTEDAEFFFSLSDAFELLNLVKF